MNRCVGVSTPTSLPMRTTAPLNQGSSSRRPRSRSRASTIHVRREPGHQPRQRSPARIQRRTVPAALPPRQPQQHGLGISIDSTRSGATSAAAASTGAASTTGSDSTATGSSTGAGAAKMQCRAAMPPKVRRPHLRNSAAHRCWWRQPAPPSAASAISAAVSRLPFGSQLPMQPLLRLRRFNHLRLRRQRRFLLHAIAERAQDRGEVFTGGAGQRGHRLRHHKPRPSNAPAGLLPGEASRQDSAGQIRSASRSRISTRTARSPHCR